MRHALLDSRQRWRDLVTMAADLAYETDEWGRFVFVIPGTLAGVVDRHADRPAGRAVARRRHAANGFNPFRVTEPVRRRRAWLKRADGSAALLAFSAAPLFDAEARIVGTRGIGVDWTEYDGHQSRVATALRRGEVLDHILWRMGQEVLAPRMMQAALDALMNAMGAEGAAVIDLYGADGAALLHRAGGGAEEVLPEATRLLRDASEPADATGEDGRPVVVAVCHTRFGAHAGLTLWRSPGSRGWDLEEKLLISAAASLIRMVLEHEAIQQEMARQARTDPLTGLLNRRAFLEEMARHIDRLDREDQPGTLMFADLDYFKPVNDRLGHEVGDQVLVRTANMLRDTLRPSDLVARLGGDEFALWMDGADHMTAAERADSLCREVPRELRAIVETEGSSPTVSIGIATTACRERRADGQSAAPRRPGDVRSQADRPRPLAGRPRGGDVTGVSSGDWPCGDELMLNADRKLASGEAARVRQGVSAATEPDVLCKLADDRSVIVRAALALNPAAPSRANEALAGDPDDRVRTLLARKLATLAPSLSAADQAELHRETWDTLSALVADEAVRVRADDRRCGEGHAGRAARADPAPRPGCRDIGERTGNPSVAAPDHRGSARAVGEGTRTHHHTCGCSSRAAG